MSTETVSAISTQPEASSLQGGSLGWRDADCLAANAFDGDALALTARFEDVLIDRFIAAKQAKETSETALIAAAAYQYGMPRLIAVVEED